MFSIGKEICPLGFIEMLTSHILRRYRRVVSEKMTKENEYDNWVELMTANDNE